jgi:YD repeat-containing protein
VINSRRARWIFLGVRLAVVYLTLVSAAPVATLAGTTTYTYDANGRLATVAAPNGLDASTATITYDPGDNRTSIVYGYQDKTPPNPPTNLAATPEAWNWIQLNWTTSLDVGGGPVASYKVYRGGSFLSSITAPPYNDQSLQGNTPYSYMVSAVDPSGNESTQAGPASATTPPPPDTTPPSVPTNLAGVAIVSGTQININLTWTGSTDTGGSGLAGYQIFRNGGSTPIGTSTVASFSDTNLTAVTTYTYGVLAYDNAGNKSALSSPAISVTTPDDVSPTTPGTPSFSSITTSSAVASWTKSTDNVGVTQYRYSLNGGSWNVITSWTTNGNTVSITLAGLSQSTPYTMIVEAGDAAGNWSGGSGSGSFTTAGPITDTFSFGAGGWQTGTYPNLTVYTGYIQGSYGTITPGTTSNGKTIQILDSSYNVSTGVSWTALAVTGFSSNPGAGWLTSIAMPATGVTLTGATAIFSYSAGVGVWEWQIAYGDLGGATVTIVHY